jgi:cysteinyl-tRNA synthetase
MSIKYLGEIFDIHGGGMDLVFPHHECEIAQSTATLGHPTVRYWIHNNMITINGQKMARSLGNFITLDDLFSGNHPLLVQSFSPMTIRFFILQAHYRSTLDFSNEALQAAGKGLDKLMKATVLLNKLKTSPSSTVDISRLESNCEAAINDDLNSPILLAHLFDGVRIINSVNDGSATLTADDLDHLKKLFSTYVFDILGLKTEDAYDNQSGMVTNLVELALQIRTNAKNNKDWNTSDYIRNELARIGISVKDRKDGVDWEIKND